MTVSSKTVILVVISISAVSLFYSSASKVYVSAKPRPPWTDIQCTNTGNLNSYTYSCCYGEVNDLGVLIHWYCATCYKNAQGSFACGAYTQEFRSFPGVLAPPTGNNTVTLPPGNITKGPPVSITTGTPSGLSVTKALNSTSPIVFRSAGNATNPTNNTGNSTAMKVARAYSPTGYCTRNNPTTCLPCDRDLPGGKEMCIPTSEWPPLTSIPLAGNATNPGNNTGTITKVLPGMFKPTGNATNATPPPTLLAKQPSSGHHHHKGGGQTSTSSSSSNTNSTGH